MDEARVQPGERLVVEPEPGEPAGPEVLDEDVGAGQQPPQDVGAGGLMENTWAMPPRRRESVANSLCRWSRNPLC